MELKEKILKLINEGKNNLDSICETLKEDVSTILSTIMQLEIDGKLSQENGTYFTIN
jgi:DNA processing protein